MLVIKAAFQKRDSNNLLLIYDTNVVNLDTALDKNCCVHGLNLSFKGYVKWNARGVTPE